MRQVCKRSTPDLSKLSLVGGLDFGKQTRASYRSASHVKAPPESERLRRHRHLQLRT